MQNNFSITAKKMYGKRSVLDVEKCKFEHGKSYAIIGANGSGKSTLLKCIARAIDFDGKIEGLSKNMVAYMPQQSVGFSFSVINNLKFVYKTREKKFKKDEAKKILKDLDLLHLEKKNAAKLSGGETQRVALARILCADAPVFLLDEFTASMDIKQAKVCQELVSKRAKDRGKTLIFTSHQMSQVAEIADYVLFLHEGKLLETMGVKDFPKNVKTKELKEFLEYMLTKEVF